MAIELSRLIEKVAHMDITLIAGREGLWHPVSWVHMVETKEASTFLEGGEISFTTGIGLNNGLSLLDLIENIYLQKAAGVILNVGPFLENIPDEVIRFGNAHSFPIFTIPWKIHIAEIMRIFSYAITRDDQKNLEIAAAFKNALFFPKQEELYLVPLSQNGFFSGWNYYVCTVRIVDKKEQSVSVCRLEQIQIALDHYLQHFQYQKYAVFRNEDQLLIIIGNYTEDACTRLIGSIRRYFKDYLTAAETCYMGVGKCTKSVRCLYKSYHQALSIQRLHQSNKIDPTKVSYSDMGIYKLLMGIEDPDIISEYYEKTIRPLEEYDKKNRSDLCRVLHCYLLHNGSVKETADELFVHRNTINYKLNKASEILNLNLSTLETRVSLALGFMLRDIL